MAISVNKVTLVGRLGKDPETKGSETEFVTFSIATSESWKDRDGNKQEKTQWHNIVVFNKAAVTFAQKYIKKGDLVYIEGTLETRKWQNNDGVDMYTTEVVIKPFTGVLQAQSSSGGSSREEPDDRGRQETSNRESQTRSYDSSGFSRDLDDDIPF